MIRQSSTRVSVDQLVKNGKKYISLLSRSKIDELINRSVKTIVEKHRGSAERRDTASLARIEADSKAEFEELLQDFQRTKDATSAVELSKTTLEEEDQEIRFQLGPMKAEQPSERTGAFEDFVRDLDREGIRLFRNRNLVLGRPESAAAVAELTRLEDVLRPLLSKLIRAERDGASGDASEIATLKKRLEKLQAHVVTMEAALKTLSTTKAFSNQQVQNLLRDLGLAPDDKNPEKKKDMLKIVLQTNQGIRRKAELEARGITLATPGKEALFKGVLSGSSA